MLAQFEGDRVAELLRGEVRHGDVRHVPAWAEAGGDGEGGVLCVQSLGEAREDFRDGRVLIRLGVQELDDLALVTGTGGHDGPAVAVFVPCVGNA